MLEKNISLTIFLVVAYLTDVLCDDYDDVIRTQMHFTEKKTRTSENVKP